MKFNQLTSPTVTRVAPFAAFMAFIALEQSLRFLAQRDVFNLHATHFAWLYLPKTLLVGLLIILFWKHYTEIRFHELLDIWKSVISAGLGLLIFLLWVKMDWTLTGQTAPPGFNPEVFRNELIRWLMIAVRIMGGVILVPIMEELFWRSFLLRYLIDGDFTKVPIGRLSLLSFSAVSILFGLEHHYVFAGIMAGVLFNITYYWTKSIVHCILAHAVANLGLACHVLLTGSWHFW